MKTLTEALRCLETPDGKPARANVDITESGVTVDYGLDQSAGMRSLAEIAVDIGNCHEVEDLALALVGAQMGVTAENQVVSVPMELAVKLHEVFLMAFTYGVRVGIEMEKSEEPMPV